MHPWHEQVTLLVRHLDARFQRIRDCLGPGQDVDRQHLASALLPYARTFRSDAVLAEVLRTGRDGYSQSQHKSQPALTSLDATVREVVAALRDRLDRLPSDAPATEEHEAAMQFLRSAEESPWTQHRDLLPAMVLLERIHPTTFVQGDLEPLRRRLGLAAHEQRVERSRLSLLDHAEPWLGAYLVDLYGRCPEGERSVQRDPHAWLAARSVRAWLGHPPEGGAESHRWHDKPADVLHAVTAFHDWAVSKLLAFQVADRVMDRFCERVSRFEALEYRALLKHQQVPGNADEYEFRRRMNIYVHDRGLDPLPEVETGNAEPDAVVAPAIREFMRTSALPVAVEVKVVRHHDEPSKIRKRLDDGLEKAATYARRWSLRHGYLVVFWGRNCAFEVPERVALADGVVVLVRVADLRSSPSEVASGGCSGVRWHVDHA